MVRRRKTWAITILERGPDWPAAEEVAAEMDGGVVELKLASEMDGETLETLAEPGLFVVLAAVACCEELANDESPVPPAVVVRARDDCKD